MNSKITILGCGSSIGVPVIGCKCEICSTQNAKNIRTRSSILIQHGKINILIDAGPDIRQQLLKKQITYLNGIILTHEHTDHIGGIHEIRVLNSHNTPTINIYSNENTLNTIKRNAEYLFRLQHIQGNIIQNQKAIIDNIKFEFRNIQHGDIINLAVSFIINNKRTVYLNDISNFTEQDIKWLNPCDYIIIDAKEYYDSKNHFGFPKAKQLLSYIKYTHAYFINMSHNIDYYNLQTTIPNNSQLSFDGLQIPL
ncbi:MAG: MBL fold metallo-hydrolase [Pseudomonadota bacterium]